jgi:hypothetical protein
MQKELSIINEKIAGIVKVDHQLINRNIGTLNDNVAFIKLSLSNTFSPRALKAFLEIHSIPSYPKYAKWKVWFNSFPVTREYKSNYSLTIKNQQHDIFVFDVTPIINRDIKRKTHNLVIKNMGSTAIYVGYVLLTVQLEAENVETYHYYQVLTSECNYKSPCELSIPECTAYAKTQSRINAYHQSSPVELLLSTSTWKERALFPTRIVDLVIEGCVGNRIVIAPNSHENMYLLSVHSYTSNYDRPQIDIKATSTQKEREVEVEISVLNNGKADAKNLMIVGILYGNTIYNKKLQTLRLGDVFTDKITVEKPKTPTTIAIRAIWNEYGETIFKEKKLNIS